MSMLEDEDIFENQPNDNQQEVEEIIPSDDLSNEEVIFTELKEDEKPKESLIDEILKSRGINNSMINIIDESGEEKEINFYDLPKEEQLEILSTSEDLPNENLDDSEIELINHLRTEGLSIEEFLTRYKESILAEVQQNSEVSYNIDAYTDHELFLLDLKNKFELTDEELQAELEKELKNEEIFNKKVAKLRTEYKQLEDLDKANKQAAFELQREEEYKQFSGNMINIANDISDFHGVVLEDNEKEETLSYLLELDESGTSRFAKDLNDPKKLYEAAWYLRYGKEAFKALEDAYEAEIIKIKKEDKPRVVVQNSKKEIKTIDQLHI